RPDATCAPSAHAWGDTTGIRALRLIADGEVDRTGVGGVARRLGITPRQLLRVVTAAAGCGPLDVARTVRAHTARLLLMHTALPVAEVAVAAGFTTVRQFNSTIRRFYASTPTALRPSRPPPRSGPAARTVIEPGPAARTVIDPD